MEIGACPSPLSIANEVITRRLIILARAFPAHVMPRLLALDVAFSLQNLSGVVLSGRLWLFRIGLRIFSPTSEVHLCLRFSFPALPFL